MVFVSSSYAFTSVSVPLPKATAQIINEFTVFCIAKQKMFNLLGKFRREMVFVSSSYAFTLYTIPHYNIPL